MPTVPTSRCYFFWPVLIFGKSTRKTGENTRKQAKTRENRRKTGAFLVLIFLWEKLVDANFYAFCNYACFTMLQKQPSSHQHASKKFVRREKHFVKGHSYINAIHRMASHKDIFHLQISLSAVLNINIFLVKDSLPKR